MINNQLFNLDKREARKYLEKLRWPEGARCPYCKLLRVTKLNSKREGLYQCCHCRRQFTVTVGTIFEGSHIPLNKWIMAFHLLCASKKGMSALQVSRMLEITYKSAWFMCHRIRHAMKRTSNFPLLEGTVEADETYVGGRTRLGIKGRGSERKVPVMALVQRNGGIRTKKLNSVSAKNLRGTLRENVKKTARIITDEWPAYRGLSAEFKGGHYRVQHKKREYVRGDVYTNSAESFFALLKRGIHGSFHHVSKEHLPRYLDEFSFRWNYRKSDDKQRTMAALRLAEGKRLVYRTLTNGEETAKTA